MGIEAVITDDPLLYSTLSELTLLMWITIKSSIDVKHNFRIFCSFSLQLSHIHVDYIVTQMTLKTY